MDKLVLLDVVKSKKYSNQKGDIFGFNDKDTTEYSPPQQNRTKHQ